MEQELKMAIYVMALEQPSIAKIAQTFLEEQNLDTIEKIREAVRSGTLVEEADMNDMTLSQMIDVLISTEQTCQFS